MRKYTYVPISSTRRNTGRIRQITMKLINYKGLKRTGMQKGETLFEEW